MKSKKNLAATLAFLMTMQASGQPWAVLANEGEVDTPEPIIGESDTGTAAAETAPDPVIEEGAEQPSEAAIDQEESAGMPELTETEVADSDEAAVPSEEEEKTPSFAEMSVKGQAPVQAVTDTGKALGITTVDLGKLNKSTAPKQENAEFSHADVDGQGAHVTEVKTWNNDFYYTVENSDTVSKLEPGQTIILHYTDTTPKEEETNSRPSKAPAVNETPAANADEDNEAADKEAYLYFYYYTEGSNVPVLKQQKVKYGQQTIQLEQREGYTLHYVDENGQAGEEAPAALELNVKGDQEFSFVYVPGTANYTVKYIFPDGTVETETLSGKVGTMTNVEAPEKDGYTRLYYSNSIIAPDGSTVVEVEYAAISYILNFNSEGGTFVNSVEFHVGDTVDLEKAGKPTREGYTFEGWTLNGKSINSITTADVPKGQTTLTVNAAWKAAEVNYTVRYWKQSVTDDVNATDADKTYDYVDTETKTALTGTTIKPAGDKEWEGFRYNSNNSIEKVVQADGSTVVDVKYDRIKCTVNFIERTVSGRNEKYTTIDTFEGLYGAPFEGWSKYAEDYNWYEGKYSHGLWLGWPSGCVLLTTYDFVTAGYGDTTEGRGTDHWTLNFYGEKGDKNGHIVYVNEKYDGTFGVAGEVYPESSNLTVHQKYAGYQLYKGAATRTEFTQAQITSKDFWVDKGNLSDGDSLNSSHNYVVSKLNQFTIQYSSWNSIVKEVPNVKYTTPLGEISKYTSATEGWNYTPELPAGKGNYYTFAGWYLDPAFTQPATDDVTMPNGNLILYAKWEAQKFDVTLHPNNGQENILFRDDIEGGSKIGEITDTPEFAGHTFAGWYMDEACTVPFSADKTVEGDTHIYAKWTANDTMPVTIRYVNSETGEALADDETVTARPNKTITVQAKSFANMSPETEYVQYTVDPGKENVIVFKYHPMVQKYYNVAFIDINANNQVVLSTDTTSNNMKQEFTVKADGIPENYELAPGENSVQIVKSEDLSADESKPTTIFFKVCKKKLQLTYDVDADGLKSVYDGQEHVLPAGTTNLATGKVVYSTDNGETWSDERPATTDANTVSVQVKATDPAGNYADSDIITVQLVVEPKKITAKALSSSKVYDGKALTAGGEIDGLVNGETATVKTSGSQTNVGSSPNEFVRIDWNGTAKEGNYTLVKSSDGTLTVTAASADQNQITLESGETTYNGLAQTLKSGAAGGNAGTTYLYAESKDSDKWTQDLPKFTDAGTYTIWVKGVNENYKDSYASATFVIKKAPLTATAGSKEKKYDGTPLTADATLTGLVNGETAEAIAKGSQTDVGSSPNVVSEIKWITAKEKNYDVTYIPGKLTVTRANAESLGLAFDNKEVGYAAADQKLDPAQVSVAKGTTITYSTDKETWTTEMPAFYDAGQYTVFARAENKNYETAEVSAVLKITQAPLKVTTESAERKYTGAPLTAPGTIEGLVGADEGTVGFTVTGSQTDVGKSQNTYSIAWHDVKAANYALDDKDLGTLTVTTAPAEDLELVFKNKTVQYNADKQSLSAAAAIEGAIIEYSEDGENWTSELPAYRDVKEGGYTVIARASKDGYETATKTAVLTITPAPVTVTTESGEKVYDGKALTAGGKIEGILDGDEVKFTVTGSQTEAGFSPNTYDLKWTEAKASNYTVTETLGTLTVKEAEGSITINDGDKNITADGIRRMYDGTTSIITAKTNAVNEDETVFEYYVNGEKVDGAPSFKDVVEHTVTVKAFNPNYNFDDGGVTVNVVITKRPVTLTSANLEKVYDGIALTNGENKLTIGGEGFADGEGLADVDFTASITNVAESNTANAFDFTLNEETTKSSNYQITKEEGALTITPRTILLQSEPASKVYDGKPLTNHTVTELDGSMGFVDGEFDSYQFADTATITNVGTAVNEFDVLLNTGKSLDNYTIEKTFGTLEVTDAGGVIIVDPGTTATIEGDNVRKVYDGQEVLLNVETKNKENVVIDTDYSYVINGEAADQLPIMLDAGEWTITFTPKDENLKDLSKTVTVTIEQRPYTVITDGDEKVYDGQPLTAAGIEVSNIVEGETYTAAATGTITNVGETDNTYSLAFNGSAKESNYKLAGETLGKLKVTEAQPVIDITPDTDMEITAEGFRKKYDGQATSVPAAAALENGEAVDGNFTYTVKDLATGEETVSKEVPSFTNSGKWEVTATTANPNCKETSKTVTVEITKRNVLIKSEGQEWVYDGNTHSHEVAVHTGHEGYDGFVEGEEPEIHSFASITNAGQTDNTFSIRFNKRNGANVLSRMARIFGIASEDPDHIADNYNIEVQYGTLKVNKAAAENHGLAANVQDKTVTYNGQAQTLDPAVSNVKDALIEYSTDGKTWSTELPAYTHAGKYEILVRASHDNYEDAQATAVLTIVPAKLTVTTESAEKEYDGKPLTAPGTVTGLAEGDEVELTVTGSQTEVGSSTNTYELKWTGADAADYEVEEVLGTLTVKEAPKKETPKNDDTPKKDTKTPSKVATALGLDPALWTSIMGAAGLGLVSAAKLSRKDRKKKDED